MVRKDSHLVALMQVLCLFAPDRPRLSDRQSVSNIYDRYILLLKHYLEARHGFTRGRTLLAAILTNLAELQALTDNYGHILLHVDPSKVDPLILEVFNLSDRGKGSSKHDEVGTTLGSPLIPLDLDTSSKNGTDPTKYKDTTHDDMDHEDHVQTPENSTTFAADHPSGSGNQFQELSMDHILSE